VFPPNFFSVLFIAPYFLRVHFASVVHTNSTWEVKEAVFHFSSVAEGSERWQVFGAQPPFAVLRFPLRMIPRLHGSTMEVAYVFVESLYAQSCR
jgi:hypothetical protein